MIEGVVRRGYWPGVGPTIKKGRTMCSDCKFHRAAMAGWMWDRCEHPEADYGSIVRNDQDPTCWDIRASWAQCGPSGKWFEALNSSPVTVPTALEPSKGPVDKQEMKEHFAALWTGLK